MSEKRPSRWETEGPFVAALLVLLGAAAAYVAGLHQSMQPLRSTEAKLLYNGEVLATLGAASAGKLAPGMRAVVLIKGYGRQMFPGSVKLVHREQADLTCMIQLDAAPSDADPPLACEAAIDPTSLPAGPLAQTN